MDVLKQIRDQQREWQQTYAGIWDNPDNLVFTNEAGGHLCHYTTLKHFKKAVKAIGLKDIRFHDLRHPYVKPKTKLHFRTNHCFEDESSLPGAIFH